MIQNAENVVPKRDHRRRKKVEPRGNARTAEQQYAEEAGLEGESSESFIGEERPLDWSGHSGQFAPVGAELECHHNAGDDAEAER